MKKILLLALVFAFTFAIVNPGKWVHAAASSETEEYTLSEITVTAEKRTQNVQEIASSIVALEGAALQEMGKVSTAQILESVPNVTFRGGKGENPNGNIAIRGVLSTQDSGSGGAGPPVTATYVDEVFQGIGGNYDVSRVEILRGPQGTLYGRSATAGVVAFHTNDPRLDKFSADVSAEMGSIKLANMQVAINAPISDKFALRVAGHLYERNSFYAGEGVSSKTREGRIKALYQPSDALSILLSLSAQEDRGYGGGWSQTLVTPTDINYKGSYIAPAANTPSKYRQASLKFNYDFGDSTLTYIGAIHDYDSHGMGAPGLNKGTGGYMSGNALMPVNRFHTEEIRWASDSKGSLTWLVGTNYYQQKYETVNESIQLTTPGDPIPVNPVVMFYEGHKGTITNYGLFTEETFKVRDDLRVTAGLRYDKTDINENKFFTMNNNVDAMRNSLNPPIWVKNSLLDTPRFHNITYKLRFEYDLTPENMLYALTATGFMPGQSGISPKMGPGGLEGWNMLPLEEKKLTSYEVGSKNRFLENRLQLNGSAFYYEYEGYQEAVNTAQAGPPVFALISVPVTMMGLEIDAQWLITPNDKLSFEEGYLSAKIKDYPIVSGLDTQKYMQLREMPGNPKVKISVGYDHTFIFSNGATLVPRAQLRWDSGHYLTQVTQAHKDLLNPPNNFDVYPYNWQDAYVVADINLTWTSSDSNFSFTGYVRNAFDKRYKTGVSLPAMQGPTLSITSVTVGDPRAWGVMFRAKF